jgi:hypothetical protein
MNDALTTYDADRINYLANEAALLAGEAACFHLALFCTAVWLTWRKGEWINEMWTMYFMAAVGHAAYDKTLANVRAYKDKQLDITTDGSATSTTSSTTATTTITGAQK